MKLCIHCAPTILVGVVSWLVFLAPQANALIFPLLSRHSQVPELQIDSSDFNGSILIVGAGAAGISAAYTLEYLGVTNYTILEAKNDFGGRVRAMEDFIDLPLDAGAEWIHTRPRILQDLVLFPNDHVTVDTLRYRPRTFWLGLLGIFKVPVGLVTFWFYREWKFKSTTWKSYLADYFYHYVADRVHLNTPVTNIDTTGPLAVVTTQDGTEWTADKVIVALPPTMLQSRHDQSSNTTIQFTPALPTSMQTQLDRVNMPAGLKVYIEFDHRFYPHQGTFDIWNEPYFMDGVFRKPTDRNVMVIMSVDGPTTDRLVQQSDDEIFEYFLDKLDRLYRGRASRNYIQHRVVNWATEPYIEGTWTVNTPGEDYSDAVLREPVYSSSDSSTPVLYLAGGYLAEWTSTVHGAMINGREVAQQVLLDAVAA